MKRDGRQWRARTPRPHLDGPHLGIVYYELVPGTGCGLGDASLQQQQLLLLCTDSRVGSLPSSAATVTTTLATTAVPAAKFVGGLGGIVGASALKAHAVWRA